MSHRSIIYLYCIHWVLIFWDALEIKANTPQWMQEVALQKKWPSKSLYSQANFSGIHKKRAGHRQLFFIPKFLDELVGFSQDQFGKEFLDQLEVLCRGRSRSPSLQVGRSTARRRMKSQIWCRSSVVKKVEHTVTDCCATWRGWRDGFWFAAD